jgi:hypothetical protein
MTLQIYRGEARLLDVSGRGTYKHERREKHSVWYYIANASRLDI